MGKNTSPVATLVLICIVLATMAGCRYWKWSECRKVGHGVLYCMLYGK